MARFDKTWSDFRFGELATFLFTTREGGRGIVQVFPKDADSDRCRLRYRLWLTGKLDPAARPIAEPDRAKAARTAFGPIVTATLEPMAGGRPSLLDLDTGQMVAPPDFV